MHFINWKKRFVEFNMSNAWNQKIVFIFFYNTLNQFFCIILKYGGIIVLYLTNRIFPFNLDSCSLYKLFQYEKLHLKFLKCILGLYKKSVTFVVLAELGRFPMHFDILLIIIYSSSSYYYYILLSSALIKMLIMLIYRYVVNLNIFHGFHLLKKCEILLV